jgi:dimethylglycine dehydrogenase
MHTINGDPNVAKLQQYTIKLYKEIEELSGQVIGLHLTGGIMLAKTHERFDWLKSVYAKGKYLGMDDLEIISPQRAHELACQNQQRHDHCRTCGECRRAVGT